MITNNILIQLADRPDEAPNYKSGEWKGLKAKTAVVVGRGTEQGNPTVDIQFEDEQGNKYVMMASGAMIESISAAVQGMRARTKAH